MTINVQNTSVATSNYPTLQSPEAKRLVKAFKAGELFCCGRVKSQVKRDLQLINPNELWQVFEAYLNNMPKDPIKGIDDIAKIIPLEKLQQVVRTHYACPEDAVKEAKDLLQQARYNLENMDVKTPISFRAKMEAVLDKLIAVLESLLSGFGVENFFKKADNDMHADFKSQKIMMLMTFFTMITAILIPLLGPAMGGLIVGSVLLGIAALSLIYPAVKPMPRDLPKGQNWSKLCRDGKLSGAMGRKKTLDAVYEALISREKHPLLIGKTGVGKTQTVKAFVHALERGDYPKLKGKKVFYFNSSDFVSQSSGIFEMSNEGFKKISDAMGRYRNNCILVFDEIHVLCQTGKNSNAGNKLKEFLDENFTGFPYVIGITTETEYYRDIYQHHAAFARRFKEIPVDNTPEEETLHILRDNFMRKAHRTVLAHGALKLLYKKANAITSDSAEPATAMRILTECINRTQEKKKTSQDLRISELKEKVQHIRSQMAIEDTGNAQLVQFQNELNDLQKEADKMMASKDRLEQKRNLLLPLKKALYKTILQTPSNKDPRKYMILKYIMYPLLEAQIRAQSQKLDIEAELNPKLIDDVIQKEIDNNKRVKLKMQEGQEMEKARAIA